MDPRVDLYHHFEPPEIKTLLVELKELIMATQAELAQQLTDLGVQLGKIGTETSTLIEKISDLEDALADASNVSPELQAAFDAVKAQVQVVDDLNPDEPSP